MTDSSLATEQIPLPCSCVGARMNCNPSGANKNYYLCDKEHHPPDAGEVAISVHDRLSESMRLTGSNVVFYDVVVKKYSERDRQVGVDVIVRRQQLDESMEKQDSYRFISDHEDITSASESVQELIRTESLLINGKACEQLGWYQIEF